MSRRAALDAIIRRVAALPEAPSLVLRGGVAAWRWFPTRPADDVDVLAEPPLTQDAAMEMLVALPEIGDGHAVRLTEGPMLTWAETEHPGVRGIFSVDDEIVQLDVGFGDPMDPPAEWGPIPTEAPPSPRMRVVRPETALAWKAHGLVEHADRMGARALWRAKDLHDLGLLLDLLPVDDDGVRRALALAFSSRNTPLSLLDRVFEGEIGRSRQSRGDWDALREDRPALPWAPLDAFLSRVGERLRPYVEALSPPIPLSQGPFPPIHHRDALLAAVGGLARIAVYERDGFSVVNAENNDDWPDPTEATLPRTERNRRLLRECRGIVFASDGSVIARPYHKFFLVGDRPESLPKALAARVARTPPRVLEKLDGAMITAGKLSGTLRLFSRRGLSPLSEAAEAFLSAEQRRAIGGWVDEGWTPIFEWCARAHRIVVDHPEPRLVLTALRHRERGDYLDHDLLDRKAFDVVPSRGRATSLDTLLAEVRGDPQGEGVVLRFDDGSMFKVKTDRYRRLHRAVESAEGSRATWEVILHGETAQLADLLPADQQTPLLTLAASIEGAITREAAWLTETREVRESIRQLPREQRGPALDALLRGLPAPRGICLRSAAAGEDPEAVVRRVACELSSGSRAGAVRRWLV